MTDELLVKAEYLIPHFCGSDTQTEEKIKLKGTNKKRHNVNKKNKSVSKICSFVRKGEECPYGDKCRFDHDMEKAVLMKDDDLPGECYNFKVKGHCSAGLLCRFSKSHISESNENVCDSLKLKNYKAEKNGLDKNVQKLLRKKEYDFKKSTDIIQRLLNNNENGAENLSEKWQSIDGEECGDLQSFDLGREKKQIDFTNKLYLAPMTTVGNLPFRRLCVEYGADVTCSEMAMASRLIDGAQSEWALLKRHSTEKCFGVQICGSKVQQLTLASQLVSENCEFDFIDINCGCPLDEVCYRGAGCAMIRNSNYQRKLLYSVAAISRGLQIPVTVKTRIGYGKEERSSHLLIPQLREAGALAVTIHGRTREQRYSRLADWQYIEQKCTPASYPMPLIGNGDIFNRFQYEAHRHQCSAIMIGRAALIKPWIFTEIREERAEPWDISSSERLDMLKRFVNYGLEHWGSDTQGVESTRRFLLEWLSFLHRYVPVGLLADIESREGTKVQQLQRINQKPPALYSGRDDLETLMASHSSSDWVKITEIAGLGRVPNDFVFIPKHKANSYNSSVLNTVQVL